MIYDNSKVRRQDRLLDDAEALELLRDGEYGVMSMTDGEGRAYGVPLNYVWDGKDCIYIHCAPSGRKLSCIDRNKEVSFCVVGHTGVVPEKFTTNYESIILECNADTGLNEEERMDALRMFLEKYSPHCLSTGLKYAEKSFHRTQIIRLEIKTFSGKRKKVANFADNNTKRQ